MKSIFTCIFTGIIGAMPLFSSNPPVCMAEKTDITPVIDGNINESCWDKAEWQTGFSSLTSNPEPSQKTRFKVLYDNERLYFAVECFEENIDKLKIDTKEKDGPAYLDDSIEIFLIPYKDIPDDPNWRMFYHFIVNAGGALYDETSLACVNNPKWNCPWKAATKIHKTSWTAEVSIPFFAFDITGETGMIWRLNVTRNRRAGNAESSSWSHLKYSWAGESPDFGFLKNINVDFKVYTLSISEPEMTQVLQGDKIIPGVKVDIINQSGKDIKCEIEAQLGENGVQSHISRNKIDLKKEEKKTEILGFPEAFKGKYSCILAISIMGKTVKFKEYPSVNINPLPLRINLIDPIYRNTIYPGQKLNKILLEATIISSPEKLKDYKFLFNLRDGGGILQTKKISFPAEKFQIDFDAASLPPGEYVIETTMYDKEKEILKLQQSLKKLAPTEGNEVWIDRDLNLVVNGKKTFVHGFLAAVNPDLAKQIKGKGFNLVHTYVAPHKNDEQLLDEILKPTAEADVKIMFYPYATPVGFFGWGKKTASEPYLTERQGSDMIARVRKFASNPSILLWYLCDEPRGAEFRRNLKEVYKTLKDIDPYHPVVALDCSPGEVITLADSSDIIVCDFYPHFHKETGVIKPLETTIYNTLKAVIETTGNKLPVWFTIEAFDRSDYYEDAEKRPFRAPTYKELRCMAHLALTAGAKGLLYFQYNGKPGILNHPEMKSAIIEGLGPEISNLTPVLLENTSEGASVTNPEIKIMLKTYKGKYFLFAVNPLQKEIRNVSFRIKGMKDESVYVLFESRNLKTDKGMFFDSFEPLGVHVYTNDMDFSQTFDLMKMDKK
ncbi:MAG: hypothetical protein A2017_19095 [Lentisphaerae bacterium GWF2_44_16]|nr:MAG: hypothetical protein A2017_19095 [Lentisphaerae bacterium GWF2_44_16]